jgi:NRPS condensation-like uncharacterized protein
MIREDLQKKEPKYIPIQISDRIQYYLQANSDQQTRFVILIEGRLDYGALYAALRNAVYTESQFSFSFFNKTSMSAKGKAKKINPMLLSALVKTENSIDEEINAFLEEKSAVNEYPMVRAKLIRCKQKDAFCLNMQHIQSEEESLRILMELLSFIYGSLLMGSERILATTDEGSEDIRQAIKKVLPSLKYQELKEKFIKPKPVLALAFE